MKTKIIKKLKQIIDPHLGENIYDIGIITKLRVKGGNVDVAFRPTSPFCPMTQFFKDEIRSKIKSIKGIKKIKIKIEI